MVSRRNGASSDVRYFSGAESRLFAIVFLLAILPMIPDSRRTNILILDEPTANMDDAALEIFRDVLLPQLQKIVPSVIVVSPNPEIVPQHAPVFTVLKKNGKSKLLKGYV
jgi:DNA repair exonuclease SbcCD ATPase subunit